MSPCYLCSLQSEPEGVGNPGEALAQGDPVICPTCSAIQTIDKDGRYRPMTDTEAKVLSTSMDLCQRLGAKMVQLRMAKIKRHARN